MARSEEPRALGRYTLEGPIATGTTATIWRAHETKTGRVVAIKRFHAHLFADRVARRRMENEAKAARRVHAPTVVSAIDRISTADEFALVFPFVPGTPLSERIVAEPPLPADQAAAIVADVADAVAAIHLARMVHRDVKPGNVLLGDDGRAHLLDFGISRTVTDEIESGATMTGSGLAIGTLPYMAPEQLIAQRVTGAADVYALGVMLYELLSGQRPFAAATPATLVTEQRVAPARIDGAPEPLVDLALRALSLDPPARPAADQMSAALRRWHAQPLATEAPTAVVPVAAAPTPAVRATPTSRRRGVAVGVAVAAAVVLIAVVALAAIQPIAGPASSPTGLPFAAAAPATTSSPQPSRTSVAPSPVPPPQASTSPTADSASNPQSSPQQPPSPPPIRGQHHHSHHHKHHHQRRHRHG
jgi:serine/threonine-protein kinase